MDQYLYICDENEMRNDNIRVSMIPIGIFWSLATSPDEVRS